MTVTNAEELAHPAPRLATLPLRYGVQVPRATPARGLDYYSLSPLTAKEQGASFVMRYLSDTRGKDLTRTEANELADVGIDCCVMWETTAQRALDGQEAGERDAGNALAEAISCGMVGARPIYFTVDFETNVDPASVKPYFTGVRSVLGVQRSGAYGGIATIRELFDAGLIAWGWQTSAWSDGAWDARAQVHQVEYDHDWDRDLAIAQDFGQWRPGVGPPHPPTAPPFAVQLPAEKAALERIQKLSKHAWAHKQELLELRAKLEVMRKAIWEAANEEHLTKIAWAKHNRAARYNLIVKYMPPAVIPPRKG